MRLELCSYPVADIQFAATTAYEKGTLYVNKAELTEIVRKDHRIAQAELHIAQPGDRVRIVGIRDVIEPRTKPNANVHVFPGMMGPVQTGGHGVTHRLSGMAMVTSAYLAARSASSGVSGADAPKGSMLDMWGAGAAATVFGSTRNLVLAITLADDVEGLDTVAAIQNAQLHVAEAIARITIGIAPPRTEIFELSSLDSSLPKVVYILGCRTNPLDRVHPGIAFYGLPLLYPLPTLMHPNEFLDGVVTKDTRHGDAAYPTTWQWQNHPVIIGLCREHGKTLNFLGVIFQSQHHMFQHGKEVTAQFAAQMAQMLGAQGAIVSRTHVSGNRFVDTMLTVKACTDRGIKAVLITPEYGGKYGEELPFLFTVPEADAIVSTGSADRFVDVETPEKVIGPPGHDNILLDYAPVPGKDDPPAKKPLVVDERTGIAGAIDWWGGDYGGCDEY